MSAIYGMISLTTNNISTTIGERFRDAYKECRIDRYEEKYIDSAYMGCALQYYTKEAENEILPIKDEENHLLFTADCLLDDRDSLMKELSITDESTPDGTLIYRAFLKWGKDCVKHLRGVFAFVVYDWVTKEVTLSVDQFANRCLFYLVRNDILYFSTLLMPIVKASGLNFELNKTWLVDSIAVLTPAMMFERRQTAYQEIFKVDCGHMLHVKPHEKPEYERYYYPMDEIKTDYSMTDEKCKKALYETLFNSIKNCIRANGEIGIQLSSGLDSSTVACIAAPFLKEQNKNLYSYTSIPLPEAFEGKTMSKAYIVDETEGVNTIVRAYPNIIPSFLDCRGKNILNQAKRIVDLWELPCQSGQNAVWVKEILNAASKEGCRIMLSGATGNCSISAGNFIDLFIDSLMRCHPVKAWKDMSHYCRKYGFSRKKVIKYLIKEYIQYKKILNNKEAMQYEEMTIVKKDLLKEVDFENRIAKKYLCIKPWSRMKRYREEKYLENAYAQIGEIDTKLSLRYGVMERDPFRNVEFINFLMSLPMEFFVNKEYDRRLVREFMEGIVPEEIRSDALRRGRQSADNTYRVSLNWQEYIKELKKSLSSEQADMYFDNDKIEKYFEKIADDAKQEDELSMRIVVDGWIFINYVNQLLEYKK